jgi:hypothetical protein
MTATFINTSQYRQASSCTRLILIACNIILESTWKTEPTSRTLNILLSEGWHVVAALILKKLGLTSIEPSNSPPP